ncbi:MAG: geranylgeranylglycerol-phosphate geranylgeranyltransferase [Candidatus Krumholzibacteriia bacterium]
MRRLPAAIAILRPHNMLATAASVVVGYHLAGGAAYTTVVLPAVFTALVTGLGNLINDYYDADIDRINRPARPIPSGRLTRGYVRGAYWTGTVLVTLPLVAALPGRLAALMVGWEALLFLYARGGKRLPLLGNVAISAIVSSAFLAGAMLAGRIAPVGFVLGLAFLLVMGRELVKGAEDMEGDRLAGASTLAVRIGAERTVAWAALPLLLCVVAAPLPGLLRVYARSYAIAVGITSTPLVLAALFLVLRSQERPVLRRGSWMLKLGMLFGIAAMALARR